MEQPNGVGQVQAVQSFKIMIEWIPATGQFNLGWPQGLEDIAVYGMLEMAKQLRAKSSGVEQPLVVPVRGSIRN